MSASIPACRLRFQHGRFLQRCAPASPFLRAISTKSAINKGLRASEQASRQAAPKTVKSESPLQHGVYMGRQYTAPLSFEAAEDKIRKAAQSMVKLRDWRPHRGQIEGQSIPALIENVQGLLSDINSLAVSHEDMNRRFTNIFRRKLDGKGMFVSGTPEKYEQQYVIGRQDDGSFRFFMEKPFKGPVPKSGKKVVKSTSSTEGVPAVADREKFLAPSPESDGASRRPAKAPRSQEFDDPSLRLDEQRPERNRSTTDRRPPRSEVNSRDGVPVERSRNIRRETRSYDRDNTESRSSRRGDMRGRELPQRQDRIDDHVPVAVTYTTAASEFLYGANPVLAALRSSRRKLYRLHVRSESTQDNGNISAGRSERTFSDQQREILSLARQQNLPTETHNSTRVLDKMSRDRPHNGIVLEVSKLPALPVVSLGVPHRGSTAIPVTLEAQSREDEAVNGTPATIGGATTPAPPTWRAPLVVFLDGITDPGNLGNILRTCHFYGVDAVAIATNTCATLSSPIVAKASAGACEAVQLLAVPKPSNFIYASAHAGWKIYAAVAPIPTSDPNSLLPAKPPIPHVTTDAVAAASPLAQHPCILMLGAEGAGLRPNLRKHAHANVTIQHAAPSLHASGVDSMNVSVAAGILMEAFLRKPPAVQQQQQQQRATTLAHDTSVEHDASTPPLGW